MPVVQADAEYELWLNMPDIPGNGTDGVLHARLVGEKGVTQETELGLPINQASQDATKVLERGQLDKFVMKCIDLGGLRTLEVRMDGGLLGLMGSPIWEPRRSN